MYSGCKFILVKSVIGDKCFKLYICIKDKNYLSIQHQQALKKLLHGNFPSLAALISSAETAETEKLKIYFIYL